jgi:hypothetical protein
MKTPPTAWLFKILAIFYIALFFIFYYNISGENFYEPYEYIYLFLFGILLFICSLAFKKTKNAKK